MPKFTPKTVGQMWQEFQENCLPEDVSALKRNALHIAFFAGAFAVLTSTSRMSGTHDEETSCRYLRSIFAELKEFLGVTAAK